MTDGKTEYYIGLGNQRTSEAEKKASDRKLRDTLLSQLSKTENAYSIEIERQIGDLYQGIERARAGAAEYLDRLGSSSPGSSNSTYNSKAKPKSSPRKKSTTASKTPKPK